MLKNKVLVDTNVVIGASVYYASKEVYQIPVKHKFFDDSMQLFGLIKKHLSKRIGIVTITIENETNLVFNKAILETAKEYAKYVSRTDALKIVSDISDSCETRLYGMWLCLLREPIDPVQKSKFFVDITEMFEELKKKAKEVDPQDIAYQRAGTQSKRFQKTAYEVFLQEEQQRYAQLKRLLNPKKEPDMTDKEILAEAAYLSSFYRQTEGNVKMFLASKDYCLSPIPYKVKSRTVTDEIEGQFLVLCDCPEEIAKQIE